jgi:hypothetical protein
MQFFVALFCFVRYFLQAMQTENEIELEILRQFQSQARVLRQSVNPEKAIKAARWELFFMNEIKKVAAEPETAAAAAA